MKRGILLFLILIVIFISSIGTAENWQNHLTTVVTDYQNEILVQKLSVHFSSALYRYREFGLPSKQIEDYSFMSPIKINNLNKNSSELEGYIVPILYQNRVSVIFEIYFQGDESFATLSTDVSSEFKEIFYNNYECELAVIAVNDDLWAVIDSKIVPINNTEEKINNEDIDKNFNKGFNLIYVNPYINQISINNLMVLEPDEYAYVNLKWISQVGEPWCWAATCASIINYMNKTNYNAQDIVEAMSNDGGASKTLIAETYRKFGLYPKQTTVLYFDEVRTQINRRNPINILVTRHSVAIKGYERYYDIADIYIIQDPNFTYDRTMDVFDRPGDIYLIVNGTKRYWYWSYYDF